MKTYENLRVKKADIFFSYYFVKKISFFKNNYEINNLNKKLRKTMIKNATFVFRRILLKSTDFYKPTIEKSRNSFSSFFVENFEFLKTFTNTSNIHQ